MSEAASLSLPSEEAYFELVEPSKNIPRSSAHTIAHQLNNVVHSTLIDKRLSKQQKVLAVARAGIEAYSKTIESKPLGANDYKLIEQLTEFSSFLKTNPTPETIVELEVIDEELEPYVNISPIGIMKIVYENHNLYPAPAIALLATKLWVLHNLHSDEFERIAPTRFLQTEQDFFNKPKKPLKASGYHKGDFGLY